MPFVDQAHCYASLGLSSAAISISCSITAPSPIRVMASKAKVFTNTLAEKRSLFDSQGADILMQEWTAFYPHARPLV